MTTTIPTPVKKIPIHLHVSQNINFIRKHSQNYNHIHCFTEFLLKCRAHRTACILNAAKSLIMTVHSLLIFTLKMEWSNILVQAPISLFLAVLVLSMLRIVWFCPAESIHIPICSCHSVVQSLWMTFIKERRQLLLEEQPLSVTEIQSLFVWIHFMRNYLNNSYLFVFSWLCVAK